MPTARHLPSAPITEAIFDIRVKARGDFSADQFSSLKPRLNEMFPKVDERLYGEVKIRLRPSDEIPVELADSGLYGFFFKSEDEKLIAQFRIDGFTLNRLKPYTSWDELFPTAIDLWRTYASVARPEAITRLALRYINHIPLPSSFTDLELYLHSAPSIPPELPQNIRSYFARATIYNQENDISAHIIQNINRDARSNGIILIFDIDAFREIDISPEDQILIEVFNQLREFKNLIFFSYLTDNILRRFE